MDAFDGTWKLSDGGNFEEFMTELGVDLVLKKLAANAEPKQTIAVNGNHMDIKTVTKFKNTHLSFTLGEEFEEKTADGRKVKTTINLEDGKLVQVQPGPPTEVNITREIKDGDLVITLKCKDVVCVRTYKNTK